jgi:hypothetical protein
MERTRGRGGARVRGLLLRGGAGGAPRRAARVRAPVQRAAEKRRRHYYLSGRATRMIPSMRAEDAFAHVMAEFLENLAARFPENGGPRSALAMMQLTGAAANAPMTSAWHRFTRPIAAAILARDDVAVTAAFAQAENPIMRQIGAADILAPSVDVVRPLCCPACLSR